MARSGKGSAFEREFCRLLSRWWTGGERDDCFWRTSNSGGRATVRGRKGQGTAGQYGDIAATDDCGAPLLKVFAFELKRGYNRATLHDLLDRPKRAKTQSYEAWIAQARRSAEQAGSLDWMIVHKRDLREPLCVLGPTAAHRLGLVQASSLVVEGYSAAVLGLSDFLAGVDPVDVRKLAKKWGKIK